ncbi:MAG: hypothetical protein WCR85_00030 [Sphaerochaeta sp.]
MTKMVCKLSNYMKSPSAHLLEVDNLEIYFSYETPIAFRNEEGTMIVSENVWGSTTGRHIAALGVDKKDRIPSEEFDALLGEYIARRVRRIG